MSPLSPYRRASERWWKDRIRPDDFVLDVGSSHGPEPHHDWVKIDTNPERPGVLCGDVRHLDFADGIFNIVRCSNVLYHVEELDVALKEIKRVLKPTGRLLAVEPFLYPESGWRRLTDSGWVTTLRSAGFRTISVDPLDGPLNIAAQLLWSVGYRSRAKRTLASWLAIFDLRHSARRGFSTGWGIEAMP
jgi:SAM-dependent methyltransferase